jgi:hypothetical protein
MAYDKLVDSAVLDAGLKQIADAIREKGGTSDNLAFPAAMADAIAAIEGVAAGVSIAAGTITPAEETDTITITHGLGKTPSTVLLFVDPLYTVPGSKVALYGYVSDQSFLSYGPTSTHSHYTFCKYADTTGGVAFKTLDPAEVDEQNCKVTIGSSYQVKFCAKKHRWLALGGE